MPRETKPKRIALYVTEQQLRYILSALENDFRLRMGQTYIDLIDDLAFQNVSPDLEDGKFSKTLFDECLWRRDAARQKLQEFMDIVFDRNWLRTQKTEQTQEKIDMWCAIRHWMWEQRDPDKRGDGVDSYPPMQFGQQPLPDLEWEERH